MLPLDAVVMIIVKRKLLQAITTPLSQDLPENSIFGGRIHKQRDIDPSNMKTIVTKNNPTYEAVHASMFQKILWQPLMAPH